jgi:hypothetical protein
LLTIDVICFLPHPEFSTQISLNRKIPFCGHM